MAAASLRAAASRASSASASRQPAQRPHALARPAAAAAGRRAPNTTAAAAAAAAAPGAASSTSGSSGEGAAAPPPTSVPLKYVVTAAVSVQRGRGGRVDRRRAGTRFLLAAAAGWVAQMRFPHRCLAPFPQPLTHLLVKTAHLAAFPQNHNKTTGGALVRGRARRRAGRRRQGRRAAGADVRARIRLRARRGRGGALGRARARARLPHERRLLRAVRRRRCCMHACCL